MIRLTDSNDTKWLIVSARIGPRLCNSLVISSSLDCNAVVKATSKGRSINTNFGHNFCNCKPIFKIRSLTVSHLFCIKCSHQTVKAHSITDTQSKSVYQSISQLV